MFAVNLNEGVEKKMVKFRVRSGYNKFGALKQSLIFGRCSLQSVGQISHSLRLACSVWSGVCRQIIIIAG